MQERNLVPGEFRRERDLRKEGDCGDHGCMVEDVESRGSHERDVGAGGPDRPCCAMALHHAAGQAGRGKLREVSGQGIEDPIRGDPREFPD
jgi:hypothetical protein